MNRLLWLRDQGNPLSHPQDTLLASPQDTPLFPPQDNSLTLPQDTPLSLPQDTILASPQDTPLSLPQDVPSKHFSSAENIPDSRSDSKSPAPQSNTPETPVNNPPPSQTSTFSISANYLDNRRKNRSLSKLKNGLAVVYAQDPVTREPCFGEIYNYDVTEDRLSLKLLHLDEFDDVSHCYVVTSSEPVIVVSCESLLCPEPIPIYRRRRNYIRMPYWLP
uniref:Uncharacterized protein n=1 Tax=Panagrolaimus superbus TaxID=310955 RepID=A0A914Z1G9_9BILA